MRQAGRQSTYKKKWKRRKKKYFHFRAADDASNSLYIFFFVFSFYLFFFFLYLTTTYVYMNSVQSLKQAIERHHAIPADSQVLLVSGGETLNSSSRVCSYSAGTDDTNPIFMFINSLEPRNPPQPWPSIDNGIQHIICYTKQCLINHFFSFLLILLLFLIACP